MNGFVYVIGCDEGFYKIGKAIDPQDRFTAVQGLCPLLLRLLHTIPCADPTWLEHQLHVHFEAKRVRPRNEWFVLTAEDLARLLAFKECRAPDDVPPWLPLAGPVRVRPGSSIYADIDAEPKNGLQEMAIRYRRTLSQELETALRRYFASPPLWGLPGHPSFPRYTLHTKVTLYAGIDSDVKTGLENFARQRDVTTTAVLVDAIRCHLANPPPPPAPLPPPPPKRPRGRPRKYPL